MFLKRWQSILVKKIISTFCIFVQMQNTGIIHVKHATIKEDDKHHFCSVIWVYKSWYLLKFKRHTTIAVHKREYNAHSSKYLQRQWKYKQRFCIEMEQQTKYNNKYLRSESLTWGRDGGFLGGHYQCTIPRCHEDGQTDRSFVSPVNVSDNGQESHWMGIVITTELVDTQPRGISEARLWWEQPFTCKHKSWEKKFNGN